MWPLIEPKFLVAINLSLNRRTTFFTGQHFKAVKSNLASLGEDFQVFQRWATENAQPENARPENDVQSREE